MNKSYVTVTTPDTVKEMLQHILDHDVLSVDTETTSLNPRQGKIVGWSISGAEGEGYYFPTLLYNPDTDTLDEAKIQGHSAHDLSITLLKR